MLHCDKDTLCITAFFANYYSAKTPEKISSSAGIESASSIAFAAGVLPLNYVGPNQFTAFSSTLVLIKVQTCDRVRRLLDQEEGQSANFFKKFYTHLKPPNCHDMTLHRKLKKRFLTWMDEILFTILRFRISCKRQNLWLNFG